MSVEDKDLRAASLMADAAGKAIRPYFRAEIGVEDKGPASGFDPVTQADREAEQAIRQVIEATFPEDGIDGEEFGVKKSQSGRTWVLDPIDGTRSFIAGLPMWGTLIALQIEQHSVLGVMDQSYTGERWMGANGSTRFYRNGESCEVTTRECAGLGQATLMSTSPDIFPSIEREAFYQLADRTLMTRYGCDCYAYAMLANGSVDLVVESGLHNYDIQALIPVIENAGGLVTDWRGQPVQAGGRVIAAGDERVHQQALAVLSQVAESV